MEKQKAEELKNLAQEFADKFQKIVNGSPDAALVMSMRVEQDDTTQSTVAVIGTKFQSLLAVNKLEEQSHIIKEYALTRAVMEINDMMGDILGKGESSDGKTPGSDKSPDDGEQATTDDGGDNGDDDN